MAALFQKNGVICIENRLDFSFCTAYLKAGEYIVWKGNPQKGHFFKKEDLRIIPIALVAALAAFLYFFFEEFFWEFQILYFWSGAAFLLLLLFLAMRFLIVPFLRKRSLYVITNQKVIVKIWRKVRTMDLADPLPIYTDFYRDGNGTISFGQRGFVPIWQEGNDHISRQSFAFLSGVVELTNISHAQKVYDMICDINYSLNFSDSDSEEDADAL